MIIAVFISLIALIVGGILYWAADPDGKWWKVGFTLWVIAGLMLVLTLASIPPNPTGG